MSRKVHKHEDKNDYEWGNMDCPECVEQACNNGEVDFYQFGGE